jgi:rubrerythrin
MDDAFEKRLPRPEDLNAMTEESLKAAFAGESQAAEKYMVFSEQADEEGFPNIARLFRAISFAETRHARNHFRVMKGINSTADNLAVAFAGESFEIDEMYPRRRVAPSSTPSRPRWTTSGCTARRGRKLSTARTSTRDP